MAAANVDGSGLVGKKVKESSDRIVRASIVQASTVIFDTPATIEKAERFIAEAAGDGAQMVVFPETYIGGYLRGATFWCAMAEFSPEGGEMFRKYRESAIAVPGPEVDRLAGFARKYKVYLVMGIVEKDGYTLYNTVIFFDPQGAYMGKHRKLMPTNTERIVWGFGDGSLLPVFDTPVGKIGSVICWENRMPLLRTAMYAKGIEIYCAPTADDSQSWQAIMCHIAQEGGCFVLGACQYYQRNIFPQEPEYEFKGVQPNIVPDSVVSKGGSVIVDPFGQVLAGPNFEGEGLVTADLDLREIARAKFTFDAVGHYSRGDVFNLTVREDSNYPVSFASTPAEAKNVVQRTTHK